MILKLKPEIFRETSFVESPHPLCPAASRHPCKNFACIHTFRAQSVEA